MVRVIIKDDLEGKGMDYRETGSLDAVFVTGIHRNNSEPRWEYVTETIAGNVPVDEILSALAGSAAHWISLVSKNVEMPKRIIYRLYAHFLARAMRDILDKDEISVMQDAIMQELDELIQATESGKGKSMTEEKQNGKSDNHRF